MIEKLNYNNKDTQQYRFQVNLGGMIELLSDHLYSSPDVYIRELLQNGVDAIRARENADEDYKLKQQGKIELKLVNRETLSFRDNGIGLTKEEIHQFLAIIGESSKKDIESGKIQKDYIGRFGIGLLSCFMVTDEICVHTRSIHGKESYEWIGKPDGTYTLRLLEEELPVGTEMFLTAKKGCQEYFEREKIESLILHYGLILPYPILLDDGVDKKRINPAKLPWDGRESSKEEILFFGELMFQKKFMDCILLHSEEGEVDGVAYILPYSVQPSTKQKHMIYLKNMLLTEEGEHILPDWTVFTNCIINARNLRPTASRENFYEDSSLESARNALGKCISDYIRQLAKEDKRAFHQFLSVHSLAVKSMAVDNDELFELFINELEFSTSRGIMTGFELRMSNEVLLYCDLDKYRQMSQIFVSQGKLLINAGYVYDQELLTKLANRYDLEIAPVDSTEIDDMLKDVSFEQSDQAADFLDIAQKVLKPFGCDVQVKQFIPANLPAFYYQNDDAQVFSQIEKVKESADNLFFDMLSSFSEELEKTAENVLYFNMKNPIVKKLVEASDGNKVPDIITILYVQTLLIGGFTLKNNELGIMNDKILNIMESLL